jgi:hypothetical protein
VTESSSGGGGAAGGAQSGGSSGGAQPDGSTGDSGAGGAVPSVRPLTPRTRITLAPGSKTRQRRPTFQFVDSTGQLGTRFVCKVDSGRWASCRSPDRVKRLAPGKHAFRVKGINSGLTETVPMVRKFKVVPR